MKVLRHHDRLLFPNKKQARNLRNRFFFSIVRGMTSHDLKYLHAFNCIRGVGAGTLRALKNKFGTFERAWRAEEGALADALSRDSIRNAIRTQRHAINPDRALEQVMRQNIWMIAEDDAMYPPRLREIPHAPATLYGRGDIHTFRDACAQPCVIGIVGTRRPTRYGLEACEAITRELADAGCAIVSGLALGIDTHAHRTAVDAQGKTVAVLGSGIDNGSLFPQENRKLAQDISEKRGAVISEYAPGTPAMPEYFPARNRIISGLSAGVLVVEAREKSGALITARFALEHNREVFALPGSIFSPTSRGPHALISEGARLVASASDILKELGIEFEQARDLKENSLEPHEKTLLRFLEEPLTVDDLKIKTRFETPRIVASLSMLELKGMVRSLGADTYQRTNKS